jgi:hypothetical protein
MGFSFYCEKSVSKNLYHKHGLHAWYYVLA